MFSPGRGQLKPLDLAQGLKRECDDQIQVLDRTRTLAPNVFSVYLHAQDYDRFASWQDTLVEELERVLMEHAEKQRYMFVRSEEHTSELQSRGHLVCRLLLEKKKEARRKSNLNTSEHDTHMRDQ